MEMNRTHNIMISMKRGILAEKQKPTGKQGYSICVIAMWFVWPIAEHYSDYKYVTARKAANYLLAGKIHDMVGITGDPRILLLDGLRPFEISVVCQFVPGHFVLVDSVRRSGVLTVDNKIFDTWSSPGYLMGDTSTSPPDRNESNPLYEAIEYSSASVWSFDKITSYEG